MKYTLLYFVVFATVSCGLAANERCGTTVNFNRLFSKFDIQPPAQVVLAGLLPNQSAPWKCTTPSDQRDEGVGVKGVFLSYADSGRSFTLGVSQDKFDPSTYQLYLHRPANGKLDAIAYLRICKWPAQKWLQSTVNMHTSGRECLVNKQIPAAFRDYQNMVVGITWDQDRVTFYTDRVYRFNVPNNRWSRVVSWCENSRSCAMQYINSTIYYNLNVTAPGPDGISYSLCTKHCTGLAANVFAVDSGGHIPDTFPYNNWFLLTNTSTLVQGVTRVFQPFLVSCLVAVPKLQGLTATLSFNKPLSVPGFTCNGANGSSAVEAFRFNVNDTKLFVGAGAVILNTVDGVNVSIVCSNNATQPTRSSNIEGDLPYYCFTNTSSGTNYTVKFLSVFPPIIREFVVTKYGNIYVNGYIYLQTRPLEAVHLNAPSHSQDVAGFWTIAATNFSDVLVEVNNTRIQRLLYCDTPENTVKCSQLSFELDDGFYAMTADNAYAVSKPHTFVTLPTFNDHRFVNVTVGGNFDKSYPPQFTANGTFVNNGSVVCVTSNQFTLRHDFMVQYSTGMRKGIFEYSSTCPFNRETINNYLTFGRICFSTSPADGACELKYYVWNTIGAVSHLAGTLYVQHTKGDTITGTPKPLQGLNDISELHLDTCTTYTIYGFRGDGVIRLTNQTLLSGVYYTSESGQLLAFKNVTTGQIYSVTPCQLVQQVAFVEDRIVGVISSANNTAFFNSTRTFPGFYYHSNDTTNCTSPRLVYSNIGVCTSGAIGLLSPKAAQPQIQPMFQGNISIPTNFTMSVRTEYVQLFNKPVSVDCAMYVCNGNERCKQLLVQYTSACKNIESALQLSARLESMEVNSMLTVSEEALKLATINQFPGGGYNFSNILPANPGARSVIEDILFDKVVTSGLGTVDEDYKRCSNGLSIADLACAQHYNGIMVLPGVADWEKVHMYSASLVGGMTLGGITSAAALPFSYAVQARLNYVALQTDVLQRNQQMLANSFNSAISNITLAFESVNNAIYQTSAGLNTVAEALSKVQDVVNSQGNALNQLTVQLQNNFQAISNSIGDIYSRLDQITADAQVDRLITGRLAALNAFVAQSLTKYAEVQASRTLAKQKVNECVKSQSSRYGFCGDDGEHIFSLTQAAPQGLMFLHTVLVPTGFINVTAVTGLCVDDTIAMTLRQSGFVLFVQNGKYLVSPRKMFQPRRPEVADFVQIKTCLLSYVNITNNQLPDIIPDYVDVNKTIDDILANLPNNTVPDLPLDVFNQTFLNLTGEIADLEARSESLKNTSEELRQLIQNINNTLVDLQWLNRVETYIKWPWYVWLAIVIALILVVSLLVFCCISTGCCGCCGCCGSCFAGCCRGTKLQHYEPIEKVHVQ
uniref:Spike glycoprotein n=1 Tax=Alphacoronavirus sp. TaxID=1906673 RepID=A0A3G3NGQ0_9ALPC|nr:spike glycoprotein [Alphacoronavirus sp.]